MRLNPISLALALAAALPGFTFGGTLNTQTVNQASADVNGWNGAIWGTPAATPLAGNDYIVAFSTNTLRTPGITTPGTFPGSLLIMTNGGTLALKHGANPATANFLLGPTTINNFGGAGTGSIPPQPLAGTMQLVGTVNYTASGTTSPQPRHTCLLATMSGSGNFVIGSCYTNSLYLAGNGTAYTGNWTNNGVLMEILGGTQPLGSGWVHLNTAAQRLTFNASNDLVINNPITGAGGVVKQNTNTVVLNGALSFTGGLTNNNGLLVLSGPGTQSYNQLSGNAVLRLGDSASLGTAYSTGLRVILSNADTGRLELSNNITVFTGSAIEVSMRNNPSVAIQNIQGNNTLSDKLSIQTGGGQLYIQADAGTTLTLAGGIDSAATGGRNFALQGDGTGIVSGTIDNGLSSALAVYKTGTGTWSLDGANSYTGITSITNGVLKLGAAGSIASSSAIGLEPGGILDAIAPGLTVSSTQTLRGRGAVLGNVTTSFGSTVDAGFFNQYGQLSLSNNLVLAGGDTLRFDLGPGTNDLLAVSGTLQLDGSTTIALNLPVGYADNGTYTIIKYSGTLLGAGSFTLTYPTTRQTFTLDVSVPGEVRVVATGAPAALTWSGNGVDNIWDVAGSQNWNLGTEKFYQADQVTFNDDGSNTPDVNVAVPVLPGSIAVSNTAKAYTFVGTNIVTGGTLTKRGTNVLTLANNGNNITGLITVSEGTLQIGNGIENFGSLGNGPINNNGAMVFKKQFGGTTVPGVVSGTGSILVTGGETNSVLTLTGTNTYTGLTVVETNCAINAHNNSALGDPSVGTIVKDGGRVGFTTLGNWNLPEPLELNGQGISGFPGALYLNTDNNRLTWSGPITVGSDTRIRVVNVNVGMTLAGTLIGSDKALQVSAEGTSAFVNFSNTVSLGVNGPVYKDGSGSMTLAGASNLFASITVSNGTAVLAGDSFLATNASVWAGTLQVLTTNAPSVGDVVVNNGTLRIGNGGFTGSFPTGIVNLAGSTGILNVNSSNSLTLSQLVTGLGRMTKSGYGLLTITSSNDFVGTLTTGSGTPTTGGTINLRNSYGLGNDVNFKTISIVRSELQLQDNITLPPTITIQTSGGSFVNDVGIGLIPIRSLSGNNFIEGPISLIGGAGNSEIRVDSGTLTLNGPITSDTTSIRTLFLSGSGNGSVNNTLNDGSTFTALTKAGTGTWTLNNANAYTGATIIQGGTLKLGASATLAGTPSITLQSNAVFDVSSIVGGFPLASTQLLAGNGSVAGSVTAAGTVAPGQGIGTLTFANTLTLAGTNLMEISRAASQNADLIVANSLLFGGELVVTNVGAPLTGGEQFNLFDPTTASGTFTLISLPPLDPSLSWDTTALYSSGVIKVLGGINLDKTNLTYQVAGTDLEISWPADKTGMALQAQTNTINIGYSSNWFAVPGSTATNRVFLPINPANGTVFYRLVY